MKIDETGVWVTAREEFAHGWRAFLKPVVTRELRYLVVALLGAAMGKWVFQIAPDAQIAHWLCGYGLLLVSRGLWWLYQPRLPWRKDSA